MVTQGTPNCQHFTSIIAPQQAGVEQAAVHSMLQRFREDLQTGKHDLVFVHQHQILCLHLIIYTRWINSARLGLQPL
jgi:hypothetical protein